jgi:RNA polymerase sigma-70 factor (ECF subfamily)
VRPSDPDQSFADIALLERIITRDQLALAELYDRHSRLLFTVIARIVRDRAEAEEVLQEVFLAVWTKAATYSSPLGSPIGWLVRLARNRAIDHFRTSGVRARTLESVEAPPRDDNPEQAATRNQERRRVRSALDTLPDEQRALIEQAYFQGMTHSELAQAFALPLGTVKTRVRAGMQALRQQLGIAVAQQSTGTP